MAMKGPLRIVHIWDPDEGVEVLECGHRQPMRSDCFGNYNAYRRRCRKCQEGLPSDPPKTPQWIVECLHYIKRERVFPGVGLFPEYRRYHVKDYIQTHQLAVRVPDMGWQLTERGYAYISERHAHGAS